jgi:hypothetical protein
MKRSVPVLEERCDKICTFSGKSNAAPGLNPLDLAFPDAEPGVDLGVEFFARPVAITSRTTGDLVRAYLNATFPDAGSHITDDNRAAAMQQADTRRIKRKRS